MYPLLTAMQSEIILVIILHLKLHINSLKRKDFQLITHSNFIIYSDVKSHFILMIVNYQIERLLLGMVKKLILRRQLLLLQVQLHTILNLSLKLINKKENHLGWVDKAHLINLILYHKCRKFLAQGNINTKNNFKIT